MTMIFLLTVITHSTAFYFTTTPRTDGFPYTAALEGKEQEPQLPPFQWVLDHVREHIKALEDPPTEEQLHKMKKAYKKAFGQVYQQKETIIRVGLAQWPELLMEDMVPLTWYYVNRKIKLLTDEIEGIQCKDKEIANLKVEMRADMKRIQKEIEQNKYDAADLAAQYAADAKSGKKSFHPPPPPRSSTDASQGENDGGRGGRGGGDAGRRGGGDAGGGDRGGRRGGSRLFASAIPPNTDSVLALALIGLLVLSCLTLAMLRSRCRCGPALNRKLLDCST